jgi:hypothetical protein
MLPPLSLNAIELHARIVAIRNGFRRTPAGS